MERIEQELKSALEEYYSLLPLQKGENPPDLLPVYEKLDAIQLRLDGTVNPQLRHYMENKSYRKAFQFLGGATDREKGSCSKA